MTANQEEQSLATELDDIEITDLDIAEGYTFDPEDIIPTASKIPDTDTPKEDITDDHKTHH